jgi:hypothetical protein
MNGMKIMSMKFEHMVFLDSLSYMPLLLRKLPLTFGLTSSKSWYPHYFNTEEHLDYIAVIPDLSNYGASEMSDSVRREFLEWYEDQKEKVFNNRCVLES